MYFVAFWGARRHRLTRALTRALTMGRPSPGQSISQALTRQPCGTACLPPPPSSTKLSTHTLFLSFFRQGRAKKRFAPWPYDLQEAPHHEPRYSSAAQNSSVPVLRTPYCLAKQSKVTQYLDMQVNKTSVPHTRPPTLYTSKERKVSRNSRTLFLTQAETPRHFQVPVILGLATLMTH